MISRVLVALTLLISGNAFSQSYVDLEGELQEPRVYFSAGAFFPEMVTSLRVDSDFGIGTEINLEELFDLESRINVFRAGGLVRIGKRSHIDASFTNMKRSNLISLAADFDFGDTVFYAGAFADLKFDVLYLAATYRYSIFEKPNWNAGVSAGLRYVRFNTSINAQLNTEAYSSTAAVGAPAILLGLHGSAYLTPRLLGRYSMETFYLSVQDVNIRVLETSVSLQYYITKNIGLGAGYASSNYQVRQIPFDDSFKGKVTFAFEGVTLFASFRL
jgi:hypothetical protein